MKLHNLLKRGNRVLIYQGSIRTGSAVWKPRHSDQHHLAAWRSTEKRYFEQRRVIDGAEAIRLSGSFLTILDQMDRDLHDRIIDEQPDQRGDSDVDFLK